MDLLCHCREQHQVPKLHRVDNEYQDDGGDVRTVLEELRVDQRTLAVFHVHDKQHHSGNARQQPPPVKRLHEHDGRRCQHGDQAEADPVHVAGLQRCLLRHGLQNHRDSEYEHQRHEEHRGPGHLGGNVAGGQRTEQGCCLKRCGGKAQVGLLVLRCEVLGYVDNVERFRSRQAGGLDDAAGQHQRPGALAKVTNQRTDQGEHNAHEQQLTNADYVCQRRVDHGADADDHTGQGGLQADLIERQAKRLTHWVSHELEAVINDQ